MIKSGYRTFMLVFCALILSGCQVKNVTGAYIPQEKIQEIQTTKPTKEQIIALIGYPNISDDQSVWYYVATTVSERRSFFDPIIVDAQILRLKFNDHHLALVEVLPNTFRNDIQVSEKYTEALGTKKNVVQQYISTAGKYNKKKKKSKST